MLIQSISRAKSLLKTSMLRNQLVNRKSIINNKINILDNYIKQSKTISDLLTMGQLTADEKRFYKENGYIVLKNLISEKELSAITEQYDELFRRKNQEKMESSWVGSDADDRKNTGAYTVKGIHNLQYHHAVFATFLYNKELLDALEDIMETSNIVLHHTKAHFKPPEKGAAYPMHQDYHYFPYEKDSMVAAFVHLDAAGPDNGGLCVYPGSHKLGPLEDVGAKESNFHFVDQTKFPIEGATPVLAARGDIVVFSYLLVHGSPVNNSSRPRRMLLVQVASADDTPLGDQPQRPGQGWLLRGVNVNKDASISKRFEGDGLGYDRSKLSKYDKGSVETTLSEADYYKKQKFLMEKKLFSPNYGYEPYWNVSQKPTTKDLKLATLSTSTTSERPTACGQECSYLYMRMGKVCAKNVSHFEWEGCHPSLITGLIWACTGDTHGDIMGNFVTYDSYCDFLDSQCVVTKHNQRIMFVHMGECKKEQDLYFKPRYDANQTIKDSQTYNITAEILMKHWRDEYKDG